MSVSASTDRLAPRVSAHRRRIDEALSGLASRTRTALREPVRYVFESGGKRVRPTVLLLVAEAFETEAERVLPAALAIEVFHNFTLIHDDVMDRAELRRGQLAVHAKWDEETALLTGNLLMCLSYDLLGEVEGTGRKALYEVYHPMVKELCRGQSLDTMFESRGTASVDAYLDMIGAKTGALFATAFELGAVVSGVPSSIQERLALAGSHMGRAFQIQDDLLDLTAEASRWGKPVGADLMGGKKTFLTLRVLECATGTEHKWFHRMLTNGGVPREDIPEARKRMSRLGVFEDARSIVRRYMEQARRHLSVLPDRTASDALHFLIEKIERRSH